MGEQPDCESTTMQAEDHLKLLLEAITLALGEVQNRMKGVSTG